MILIVLHFFIYYIILTSNSTVMKLFHLYSIFKIAISLILLLLIILILVLLYLYLFFRNLLNPLYLSMSQPVPSGPHLKIKGKILNMWGLFYALTTFTVALGTYVRVCVCMYVCMCVCFVWLFSLFGYFSFLKIDLICRIYRKYVREPLESICTGTSHLATVYFIIFKFELFSIYSWVWCFYWFTVS